MTNLREIGAKIKSEWEKASRAKKILLGYCMVGPLGFFLFPIYLGIRKLWRKK